MSHNTPHAKYVLGYAESIYNFMHTHTGYRHGTCCVKCASDIDGPESAVHEKGIDARTPDKPSFYILVLHPDKRRGSYSDSPRLTLLQNSPCCSLSILTPKCDAVYVLCLLIYVVYCSIVNSWF